MILFNIFFDIISYHKAWNFDAILSLEGIIVITSVIINDLSFIKALYVS